MKNFALNTLSVLVIALALSSCGIEKGNKLGDDKDFGIEKSPKQKLEVTTETPPLPTGTEQPTNVATTPSTDETTTEEPPLTSGHDLLGNYHFKGYFDSSTVVRIINREGATDGEIKDQGLLDPIFKGLIEILTKDESQETLDIITTENGRERQSVKQAGHTANGDFLSGLKGEEGQSGTQTLDWVLSKPDAEESARDARCPKAFICVDRILWQPEKGNKPEKNKDWTYCFRDLKTNNSVAVPYGPNSQFSADAFKSTIPQNGLLATPFIMTKHPGLVSCDDPEIVTWTRDLLQWKISLGDLRSVSNKTFYRKAIYKPIVPDSEIVIQYNPYSENLGRMRQPKKAPFIDQMSRFNSKTRYFLNGKERIVTKIERTIQTPMINPIGMAQESVRSSYSGTFFAGLIDVAFGSLQNIFSANTSTSGLQMIYSFEFCGHKAVNNNLYDHCTGIEMRRPK